MELPKPPVPASRTAHGQALKQALEAAVVDGHERREKTGIEVHGAAPGIYVEFEAIPGWDLAVMGLEHSAKDPSKRIEVVAVTLAPMPLNAAPGAKPIQRATVFVPDGQIAHFIQRLEKYALSTPRKAKEQRFEDTFDRVMALRLATLRALWTDAIEAYPQENETIWWEVWLRRHDGSELERLMEFAGLKQIDVSARRLQFDDRIVTLVRATSEQLSASIDVLNDLAEVRRAKETAAVFSGMAPDEQAEWAKDLRLRTQLPPNGAPAVCLLDTGVTRGHPLLELSLAATDCHSCEPVWGTHDHHGHGTEMAGLALYGDLTPVLAASGPLLLRHGLESVKILPPRV